MNSMPTISSSCNFVVVWEWENRPNRWRPYSPEVTQLLERAHNKKLNRIYLKDAEPLLADFYINMTNFQQCCESSGDTYNVRREFYSHNSPAGKGICWEWLGDEPGNWHTYDMEVQVVLEEYWLKREQTLDVSKYFPGCPYIMNFCNLTQVRKTSGFVRQMRRGIQASYPLVRLTQAEIAAMVGRREERRRLLEEEMERQKCLNKHNNRIKNRELNIIDNKGKKTMKHLVNTLLGKDHKNFMFGSKDHKNELEIRNQDSKFVRERRVSVPGLERNPSSSCQSLLSEKNLSHAKDYFSSNFDNYRKIGHPSTSEANICFPQHSDLLMQPYRYRRFQDSSFSSFSDNGSMIRRPSLDTISTYLSHESMMRNRYGMISQSGFDYDESLGSQELLDLYGDEDSVFTEGSNEDGPPTFRSQKVLNESLQYSRSPRKLVASTKSPALGNTNVSNLRGPLSKPIGHLSYSLERLDCSYRTEKEATNLTSSTNIISKRRTYDYEDGKLQTSSTNEDMAERFDFTDRGKGLVSSRVLSDPYLFINQHNCTRSSYQRSKISDERTMNLIDKRVSRGTMCPHNKDLSESQVSIGLEDDLYANHRQISISSGAQNKQNYFADPDRSANICHKVDERSYSSSQIDKTTQQLPMPPKLIGGSHQSLHNLQYEGSFCSPEKLRHDASFRSSNLSLKGSPHRVVSPTQTVKGYGKKPVPAPRIRSLKTPLKDQTTSACLPADFKLNAKVFNNLPSVEELVLSFSVFIDDDEDALHRCEICLTSLNKNSKYSRNVEALFDPDSRVISLLKCAHRFHLICVKILAENQNPEFECTHIQCPTCDQVLGDKFGGQPETGVMSYKVIPKGLPGYEDYHSIQLTYNFQNGVQSKQHPNPGQPYIAIGFPRTAFLPDTDIGRKILKLLEKAFNAGHTFTVSPDGDIVWAHIPHRTDFDGSPMTIEFLDGVLCKLNELGIYT